MNNLQKAGGFAALYLATAYLLGLVLFIVVLDYPSIVDPAQKIALLVNQQAIMYATNLILYVIFGVLLVVLLLALYGRLGNGARATMQVATVIGFIWAGSLIASGMVLNAGIAPTVALYGQDPAQAALSWQVFEAVASGLGNGNGEILGGLMTLLISWAALRSGGLPRLLNYLGVAVGLVGIVSTVPGLADLAAIFGISQMAWFIWLAVILLRPLPVSTADHDLVKQHTPM
ncbi:DUF4386 family protein [Calidithermus chliarophilus]|uniref:DUF4386 family protein n=1 Tax=Calidithermus chliarophilus TaxID=52023 RepID=UPI0003F654C6|nr:DUF4386 family protein [Calidithermus chliarophilus]